MATVEQTMTVDVAPPPCFFVRTDKRSHCRTQKLEQVFPLRAPGKRTRLRGRGGRSGLLD